MSENCGLSAEQLSAFVDGELPAEQRQQLAQHITNCAECSRQVGAIFSLKAYVSYSEQRPVAVPTGLWKRLRRKLGQVDSLARSVPQIGPRAAPAWRLPALVATGVVLIAVAVGARHLAAPRTTTLSILFQAHQTVAARVAPSRAGLARYGDAIAVASEVAWQPTHAQLVKTQVCSGRQITYDAAGVVISYFVLPCNNLDTATLDPPVYHEGKWLYLATTPELSIVAWREGNGWGVLVADLYLEQLLPLAKLPGKLATPGVGF